MSDFIYGVGVAVLVSVAIFLCFLIYIMLIHPALQTLSLALFICISLIRTKKLSELNWLAFPKWLWTYFREFMHRGDWEITYKISGTNHQCNWRGLFKWEFLTVLPVTPANHEKK